MSKAAADTLEKVSGEFQAEVMADLEAGRRDALSRIESARKEAAEAVSKILETSVKQAESTRRQIIGASELAARNVKLKSLEKAVNEVFDLATKEISSTSGSSYEKSIAGLIKEGMGVIGQKAKVQCSTKDKKVVASAIRKLKGGQAKLTLDDTPVETLGGVVLTTIDGSIRFDNTFEARLERMKPTLRKDVAGILAGA
ncbi:MAG TPA: V-type ATP synthase subunit E family protein [Nitrososphaerales archaeon]|nr:V-type ATP synthase subunit E family protein [Nitrososphaerales archaeon]